MNAIQKAALKLQSRVAERPEANEIVRHQAAMGDQDVTAINPLVLIALQALLGMITGCFPDSGFLAWIRGLFARTNRYAKIRKRILSADLKDRSRAAKVVNSAMVDHMVDHEEGLGVSGTEIVDDAIEIVREMSEVDFALLVRSSGK